MKIDSIRQNKMILLKIYTVFIKFCHIQVSVWFPLGSYFLMRIFYLWIFPLAVLICNKQMRIMN